MAAVIPPREIPVVVISSGDQPPEQIASHRALAENSFGGRHITAARSGLVFSGLLSPPPLGVGGTRVTFPRPSFLSGPNSRLPSRFP